jgi:hypothetical protein
MDGASKKKRSMRGYQSVLVVAQAIMSLTAILNKPPVSGWGNGCKFHATPREETVRTVVYHCDVFLFGWTLE